MSSPVIITFEAEQDIQEIKAWYEDRRAGLGVDFVFCLDETIEYILHHPLAAERVEENVRRVMTRRFPYCIYYDIGPDAIYVLAVYHTSRDPRDWQR